MEDYQKKNSTDEELTITTGAVCMLDRLGTKSIWARQNLIDGIKSWESTVGRFREFDVRGYHNFLPQEP